MNSREKIQKLLALSTSDNENEATAALLKAKELMAEHKLTEHELKNLKETKVIRLETGIQFTLYSEIWIYYLSEVIANNYCCKEVRSNTHGQKKGQICFIGLEEDAEICKTVFIYAVDCVRSYCNEIRKKLKKAGFNGKEIRVVLHNYGTGFAAGLKKAYDAQKKKNEKDWGLILVTPKEVYEKYTASNVKHKTYNNEPFRIQRAFQKGQRDGEKFNPAGRVEAKWAALPG